MNVASLAGRNGFAGGTAYTASKHAVLGFGRSLMLEVRKEGIRVITICPGSVDTGMLRDQPMLKSDPQRILQPEDVAEAILHAVRLPRPGHGERARHPPDQSLAVAGGRLVVTCASAGACRSRAAPAGPRGGWELADIVRETGCGRRCGLCRPYLRRMLRHRRDRVPRDPDRGSRR